MVEQMQMGLCRIFILIGLEIEMFFLLLYCSCTGIESIKFTSSFVVIIEANSSYTESDIYCIVHIPDQGGLGMA